MDSLGSQMMQLTGSLLASVVSSLSCVLQCRCLDGVLSFGMPLWLLLVLLAPTAREADLLVCPAPDVHQVLLPGLLEQHNEMIVVRYMQLLAAPLTLRV